MAPRAEFWPDWSNWVDRFSRTSLALDHPPACSTAGRKQDWKKLCVLRRMLALGVCRGRVMLVDEATAEVRWDVEAHLRGSSSESQSGARVAMSPDGRFVASVGRDEEQWKLWDVSTGAVHMAGATHDGSGACICRLQHHTRSSLQAECPVVAHIGGLNKVVFSPCGLRFATGGLEGAVIAWNTQTGEAELRMQGFTRKPPTCQSLTYSADGARLASGSGDQWIRVWDTTTGALLRTIEDSHPLLLHVQFSPSDNRRLASAGMNGRIHLWDVDSGEKEWSMEGRQFAVFSPDGRTIATGSAPGRGDLHLLDAESGAIRFRMFISYSGKAMSASFSIDGSKLASVSHDGTCTVWDTSTGELLHTIDPGAAAFSVSWGRDWVRDTQRGQAFAMGHHPRLGTGSQVLELEVGVVRMILDRV